MSHEAFLLFEKTLYQRGRGIMETHVSKYQVHCTGYSSSEYCVSLSNVPQPRVACGIGELCREAATEEQ